MGSNYADMITKTHTDSAIAARTARAALYIANPFTNMLIKMIVSYSDVTCQVMIDTTTKC